MPKKYIRENCDNKLLLYRSLITQIPIGQEDYRQGAQWLYNARGELIDFSATTQTGSTYDTTFFGRADNRQRFRKGDIVEVCDGQNVRLALLVSPPPDIDRCWHIYLNMNSKHSGDYPLDWSDDSCLLVDGRWTRQFPRPFTPITTTAYDSTISNSCGIDSRNKIKVKVKIAKSAKFLKNSTTKDPSHGRYVRKNS